jgi:hypothetical protein
MVGLSAVFNRNTFGYSVVAVTETTGFLIEKEAIAALVKQNGAFAFSIIRRYCEHNSLLYTSLDNVLHQQTNGRMATVLLSLAPENYGGEDLFRHLSRRELADFAGISTEGAVKVLKSFEKDGLIKLSDKSIILLDPHRLEEISRRVRIVNGHLSKGKDLNKDCRRKLKPDHLPRQVESLELQQAEGVLRSSSVSPVTSTSMLFFSPGSKTI